MRRDLLLNGIFALLTGSIAFAAACGGNVVVDKPPLGSGAGGQGGSSTGSRGAPVGVTVVGSGGSFQSTGTSNDASSSVVTGGVGSTGSGPSCSCNDVCAKVAACGAPLQACNQFCPTASVAEQQCLCDLPASCQGLQQCFAMGTTTTGGGGGAGGAPTSPQCNQCRIQADQGPCGGQLAACQQDPDCSAIRMCHHQCGYGPTCSMQCEGQHPNGTASYLALIECSVCSACSLQCAQDTIEATYCALGGSASGGTGGGFADAGH